MGFGVSDIEPLGSASRVKGKVFPCASLIKHYAMNSYGGVDV
jgi:hypothetical protein